jgi:hypothetical protein
MENGPGCGYAGAMAIGRVACSARAARPPGSLVRTTGADAVLAQAATMLAAAPSSCSGAVAGHVGDRDIARGLAAPEDLAMSGETEGGPVSCGRGHRPGRRGAGCWRSHRIPAQRLGVFHDCRK